MNKNVTCLVCFPASWQFVHVNIKKKKNNILKLRIGQTVCLLLWMTVKIG